MASSHNPAKLDGSENEEGKASNHLDTEENDGAEKEETEELDGKIPISSVQSEYRTAFLKQAEGKLQNAEINDGQSFEVFNETECMKFAEKLHKIVEELRMNRVSERENELRIQKLMSEKSDLERLKDEEIMKNNELVQNNNQKQDEARKQFQEKLHSLQEDKTKHMLERQSGEKEIKALKDEIRALHVTKYSMEKLIKEQERQIQSHGSTTSNYLTQLAKLEKQCKDVFKQCSQIIKVVDKVEANVNASAKLHKKLTYVNDHQNCILQSYKQQLDKTKQDLITLEARQASLTSVETTKESLSLVHLENELRMQKELCQQVQVQLNDKRQENQELLKSLNSAHELLEKHVETNSKYAETEAKLQLEMDKLKTDCEKLKEELEIQTVCVQEKDAQLNEAKAEQETKEKELNEKLEKLIKDYDLLDKEKTSLEELNSTWSHENVEQKEEIDKLTAKVSELEGAVEEAKKETEKQNTEKTKLKDDLKKQITCYEDLFQKNQKEYSEMIKWRKRTKELLEREEKKKTEEEKQKKDRHSQETQTENIRTQNKETSMSDLSEQVSTTTSSTDEGTHPGQSQAQVRDEAKTPEDESIFGAPDRVVGGLQESNKTQQRTPVKSNPTNEAEPQQVPKKADGGGGMPDKSISSEKNTEELIDLPEKKNSITNESCDTQTNLQDKPNTTTTFLRDDCDEQHDLGIRVLSKKNELPSEDQTAVGNCLLLTNTNTDQHPGTSSRGLCLKRTNESLNPKENASPDKKKGSLTQSGLNERDSILSPRTTRRRTTLLAVVKPAVTSRGMLSECTSSTSQRIRRNERPEDKSKTHLASWTTTTSDNLSSGVVHPPPIQPQMTDKFSRKNELRGCIPDPLSMTSISNDVPVGIVQPPSMKPQLSNNTLSSHGLQEGNLITHSVSTTNTSNDLSHKAAKSSPIQPAPPAPPNNPFNEKFVSPRKQIKEGKFHGLIKQGEQSSNVYNINTEDTNQPTTSINPQEGESRQYVKTSREDGNGYHTVNVENFGFSDEEEESIPRTIGSQIDRIEAFLKNDRLRLSKKRKNSDE